MNAQQKVFRVRRNYNQWVANETLEDYALRFTAKRARRWSSARVSHTALGAISFLALEAIGGAITLSYGFTNAAFAILVVGLIIFLTGIPISYHAAKQGTDIDLLTRGAGFGYIGSTITSLIYASFTFIFFALEAAIMAMALELAMGIPLSVGYVISSLVVIPLVTHGITLISRFQIWTQPVWIALQLLPLIFIILQTDDITVGWLGYTSENYGSGFNLLAFGAASAVMFSLIAQIGEQVDFLRFLPSDQRHTPRWWCALLAAGPGWILIGSAKILIGSFLAIFALSHGIAPDQAADPNHMYLTAFSYITPSPIAALWLTCGFVILSQLKINVTNAYAGSIAWSNFFSRLTHNHPGRVVWLVFNVAIALMLMELGIFRVLEKILGVYSIVALAWVGSLVADLVINRPLGLRPKTMEFKRAHLYDINPVGVGSMTIASIIGFMAYFGSFGETLQALASFLALGVTFIAAPLIAWATGGRYYIARDPIIFRGTADIACCICGHRFEPEDMTHCPAYAGSICSLCCSLDSRCHDMCKHQARMTDQLMAALNFILPAPWNSVINSRLAHFLGLFFLINLLIAGILGLVYVQITLDEGVEKYLIAHALINIFFILAIVSGVISWMFALVHDSRRVAQEESTRQTELLMAEIAAHKHTDTELQKAKEIAEAANQAKSRYLTGISHELRSPLNAIMGYAQLLEQDPSIPTANQRALGVILRSSEHLADLIEGLLDISRVEAGRLELSRSDVSLNLLLEQIVSMFSVQAQTKGIGFRYQCLTPLPTTIRTDEKRLRQILINLLSNAIKYTFHGEVIFSVSYRSQVAVFSVIDSGVGIAEEDLKRIFHPFERVRKQGSPHITGTGLGLTITQLLVDILGGNLSVTSEPNKGSKFTVSLMLSSTVNKAAGQPDQVITGYKGETQTAFVVDDEPSHRSLLHDMLTPLGFEVLQAPDGETCWNMIAMLKTPPLVFLLDIAMPGMDGWTLAEKLRSRYPQATIIMVSANASEQMPDRVNHPPHDAYLVKPLRLRHLLDTLSKHTQMHWRYRAVNQLPATVDWAESIAPQSTTEEVSESDTITLPAAIRQELIQLAKIGYVKGLRHRLNQLAGKSAMDKELLAKLMLLLDTFQLAAVVATLEETP